LSTAVSSRHIPLSDLLDAARTIYEAAFERRSFASSSMPARRSASSI
jgi:hypothetical protein